MALILFLKKNTVVFKDIWKNQKEFLKEKQKISASNTEENRGG